MLREIEKRDQQKVTREKEREREQRKLFLFFYSEQRALCVVRFFVTFGEREDRETKRRYLYTSRAFGACVCDNSTKRYKNIYINKEKIPLDLSLSLSLSLSLVVVVVVVSRRAFSLALVVHFSSVEYLLLSRCVQFFVSFS